MSAGILGLTGINGFLFYLLASCYLSALLWLIYLKGNPSKYFKSTTSALTDGIAGNCLVMIVF
jgi:ER membrane protein complex subunit 6